MVLLLNSSVEHSICYVTNRNKILGTQLDRADLEL